MNLSRILLITLWGLLFFSCGSRTQQKHEEKKPPKHAYAFGNVGRLFKQIHEERVAALGKFHSEVTKGNFPYPQTNISMHDGEKDKFLEALDKWSPTHQ